MERPRFVEAGDPIVFIIDSDSDSAQRRGEPRRHGPTKRRAPAGSPVQQQHIRRERLAGGTSPGGGTEHCAGCGYEFQPVETAFAWQRAVVCGKCYQRNQAARILAALVAPRLPATVAAAPEASGERGWPHAPRRVLGRPAETAATRVHEPVARGHFRRP
jgi:hypothetical protein